VAFYNGWLKVHYHELRHVKRFGVSGRLAGLMTLFLLGVPNERLNRIVFESLGEIFDDKHYLSGLIVAGNQIDPNFTELTLDEFKRKTGVIVDYFHLTETSKTIELGVNSVDVDPTLRLIKALEVALYSPIEDNIPIPWSYYHYDLTMVVIPWNRSVNSLFYSEIRNIMEKDFNKLRELRVVDLREVRPKDDPTIREVNVNWLNPIEVTQERLLNHMSMITMFDLGFQSRFHVPVVKQIVIPTQSKQLYAFLNQDLQPQEDNPFFYS
jgi:hypothetical protein